MSLFSRLFGRKRAIEDRRQSNDWKAGDLAVCVDGTHWFPGTPTDPQEGEVLRVTAIEEGVWNNRRSYYLFFAERASNECWEYTAFRKAVEDTEPAEAEFTALIKRPVKKPVRA